MNVVPGGTVWEHGGPLMVTVVLMSCQGINYQNSLELCSIQEVESRRSRRRLPRM